MSKLESEEYKSFESIRKIRENGTEYWEARKLSEVLEYKKWENFNKVLDKQTLVDFIDYRYLDKFMNERFNRDATTTDREGAIIFDLPSKLIEGVLIGRKVEHDNVILEHIKSKLPDCYICNIDGKVIVK